MLGELLYMILRGLVIGVVVSAPMGPVGIFCIQRTLDRGRLSGFYTGVGAAISDLIYCLLTGFGLSFIEDFINDHRVPIQLFGALVLIGFGTWLIRKKPDGSVPLDSGHESPTPKSDILKGFALTFSNPLILFLIIGLFAQFNFVIEGMRFYHYLLGFLGIISGALGWWWLVTFFVDKIRGHFNQRTMKLINTVVGVIILVFAAVGICSSVSAYASPQSRSPYIVRPSAGMASMRVADIAMKGWQADVYDSFGRGFRFIVRPGSQDDAFGDTGMDVLSVQVEDRVSGNTLATAVLSEGIDPFRGVNSWRLSRVDGMWRLFAGNRDYRLVASFPDVYGDLRPPVVKALPGGNVDVGCETCDFCRIVPETVVGLDDFLQSGSFSKTEVAGVYVLYDSEYDDTYASVGGVYRIALMPDGDDFDIVYVEGARILADRWHEGMVKGRLHPTSFVNVFDVEWTDAAGSVMDRDVHADFDPLTQVLAVRFPYQNSILRFRKE